MAGSYTARVKGRDGLFPRGYPWTYLAWTAVAMVVLPIVATAAGYPSSAIAAVLAAGLVCAIYVVWSWSYYRPEAFAADAEGVQLGVRRTAARQYGQRYVIIPWAQVQQISMSPSGGGSTAEILLAPLAPVSGSVSKARSGLLALALEALPISVFLCKPQMLCPLADPPRYRVPLFGVTAAEAVAALRPLAPASVPVTEVASSYAPQ